MKRLVLVFTVLVCGMVICATGQGEGSGTTGEDETVVLEFMWPSSTNVPPRETDAMWQGIYERFNVDAKLILISTEYEQQLNVKVASGILPDWFVVPSKAYYTQYVKEDLLLAVSKYEDRLPDYYEYVSEDRRKLGYIDGQLYSLISPPSYNMNSYWIRQDWVEKVGLSIPETLDDYVSVMKAFTEKDPDGNGKQDTFGITGDGIGAFIGFFGAYGVPMPGELFIMDGELISAVHDPRMKDALTKIKEIIEMGVVDPGLLSTNGGQAFQKQAQQQVGLAYQPWWRMLKVKYAEQLAAVNPDAEWNQVAAPEGPGGRINHYESMGVGSFNVLNKKLEADPVRLDRMLKVCNFVSSEEGQRLVLYGKEGLHYKVNEEGRVEILPKMYEDDGVLIIPKYQFTGRDGRITFRRSSRTSMMRSSLPVRHHLCRFLPRCRLRQRTTTMPTRRASSRKM